MVSKKEIKSLLQTEPQFDDITNSLRAIGNQPKGIIQESREVIAIARKFKEEIIRPNILKLDLKMTEDPNFLPWDFVEKANEWGFYTMFMPKILGGKGYNFSCVGYFIEEIGSACLAMANLICVHYLGYTMLVSSWNMKMANRISKDVIDGERTGNPCLLTLAMTEPDAGTDSQNVEMMDAGNLRCHAKRVENGYVVNGTKIFISCGHLSTWHILHAYTDLKKASSNTVMLAVKTGSKGFSFGKKENKMGQKGCPASELVFNDCFIPDEDVCISNEDFKGLNRSVEQTNEQIFAYIWGASRMGVGSFGTAAARGAFEETLKFASENTVSGKLLINHEWCQSMLAEMYTNVAVSRASYMEATQANALHGLWKLMNIKPAYYFARYAPKKIVNKFFDWVLDKPATTRLFRKICFDFQTDEEIDRVDGWGSLVKAAGTDAAVKNCQMALEIMGQAGIRHDCRAEKILRDSKLLQIYEGTNQVNRINVFKRLIRRSHPHAECLSSANV